MRYISFSVTVACTAVILFGLVFAAGDAAAQPVRETIEEQFSSAIKLYREGEYEKAAVILDNVLKMSPTSKEALFLREYAGIGILVKMLKDPRFDTKERRVENRKLDKSHK